MLYLERALKITDTAPITRFGAQSQGGIFLPKSVAIGFEDIKEIIDKDRYYIDKTHMIRDLIDKGGKVDRKSVV